MFKWFVFVALVALALADPEPKAEPKAKPSFEGGLVAPQYYGGYGGYAPIGYGLGYGLGYGGYGNNWGYPGYAYPGYSNGYWPQYGGYAPYRQW